MPQSQQLVLDSSVLVKWLNRAGEQDLTQANKLLDELENGQIAVIVPYLAAFEVGNSLLKGKKLTLTEAELALEVFYTFPLQFEDFNQALATQTYRIAQIYNITFHDAAFLALADKYHIPLVTANPRHQRQAVKEVQVIALKDYA